jgi:hypothetical protein
MEVAILAGLGGIGYALTRATEKKSKQALKQPTREGFTPGNTSQQQPNTTARNNLTGVQENFKVTGNVILPSEPMKGKQGTAFDYATVPTPYIGPTNANIPQVAMRADRVEEQPNYLEKEAGNRGVYSSLLGSYIPSDDFTHQNMVPFYGGSVKQTTSAKQNQSLLDNYSGTGSVQIEKREVEAMFDYANTPYGYPSDLSLESGFVKDRMVAPRNRAGERPFEPTRVAPGIGQKGGALGTGGFQQLEVNEIMRPRDTNLLRTADNPKMTYKGVVVPGKHYIGKGAEDAGEVRHYRPDRFYIDEGGERLWATPAGEIKEMVRSAQVLPDTSREETTQEYMGIGASQGFGESYVAGSYRAPMSQQFGGAGYRNANMEGFYTPYVDSQEADYGRSSFENRDNERTATSDRMMALNLAPAETGAVAVHYEDQARPTRRGDTIGTARPVGGVGIDTPAITVWDPMDVARTTIKEGTIDLNRYGISAPASAPARLTVYDPNDIARRTQKEQLSKNSYAGIATGVTNQAFASQNAGRNMRQSSEREATLGRRKPTAGNGNIAIFSGEINQTSKRPNSDIMNNRAMGADRVVGLPPGKSDIGVAKLRVPLRMNQSEERFGPEMMSALKTNPYAKPLFSM